MSRPVAHRRSLAAALFAAVLMALAIAGPAFASPAKVGPPTSSRPRSVTRSRAASTRRASAASPFADCPNNSWATGTNAAVNSYLTRVKALNPAARAVQHGRGGNDAVTGAKAAGLAGATGQAQTAVAGNPDLRS